MPASGDHYVMPQGLGDYLVVKSHDETGGEYVEMEWTLPPGAFAPPAHRHPSQVEEYEVLEGRLDVMIEGTWRTLEAGDSAVVPVGASHTFRVPAQQAVRVRNFHRPGSRFDAFVQDQYLFAISPQFKGLKRPSTAVMMSKVWNDHADLLVPSNRLLRWAMAGLARFARSRGY